MMPTDVERREVASHMRVLAGTALVTVPLLSEVINADLNCDANIWHRLADLIAPSYKPNAEYEAWYDGLSHFGDERRGPSTIRELIEEIVWAALTVDLGPNGNTDPSTGIDEGGVYTDKLFAEWEREALRLSGGIDRDALLALADEMEFDGAGALDDGDWCKPLLIEYARRIREALGVGDGR